MVKLAGMFFICAALILCVFHFCFFSGFFLVSEIIVSGIENAAEKDIQESASIKEGANTMLVSLKNISKEVGKHPWVKKAYIKRELPSRLAIKIEEREPVIYIACWDTGNLCGLDSMGYILPPLQKIDPAILRLPLEASGELQALYNNTGVPLLLGLSSDLIKPGEKFSVKGSDELVFVINNIIKLRKDIFNNIWGLRISEDCNVTLYPLLVTKEVRCGSNNLEKRLNRLAKVWDYLRQRDIESEYIDLRYDVQGVVCKPLISTQKDWLKLYDKGLAQ